MGMYCYFNEIVKSKTRIVQIFNLMNVDQVHFFKDPNDKEYTLHTRKTMFKTEYNTYIPIKSLSDAEIDDIMTDETSNQVIQKGYVNKTETPILHKIRAEAIEYLKSTNRLKTQR